MLGGEAGVAAVRVIAASLCGGVTVAEVEPQRAGRVQHASCFGEDGLHGVHIGLRSGFQTVLLVNPDRGTVWADQLPVVAAGVGDAGRGGMRAARLAAVPGAGAVVPGAVVGRGGADHVHARIGQGGEYGAGVTEQELHAVGGVDGGGVVQDHHWFAFVNLT